MARRARDLSGLAAGWLRPESDSLAVPRAAATVATAALVFGLLGTLLAVAVLGGKILPGVSAAGVPVGWTTPAEASLLIAEQTRRLAGTPIELRAQDTVWRPTAAELGVRLDPDDLADRAYDVGRVGVPLARSAAILGSLIAGTEVAPDAVSGFRVGAWIETASAEFDRPATDATLAVLPDGQLRMTPEREGRLLDRAQSAGLVQAALSDWLATTYVASPKAPVVSLPVRRVDPAVTVADLAATRHHAESVLAQPLTLRVEERRWTLDRSDLAGLLAVERDGALAHLTVDAAQLGKLVDRLAAESDRAPRDASLEISPGGRVLFEPDRPGRRIERGAAMEQLRAAVLSQDRTADLEVPIVRIPAALRAEHLEGARLQAERALAGPLAVAADDAVVTLEPAEIAPLLSLGKAGDGVTRTLGVDVSSLRPRMEELASKVDRPPRHARLRLVGGAGRRPQHAVASMPAGGRGAGLETIQEGVPGRRLDVDRALDAVKTGLTGTERRLTLPLETIAPITAADKDLFGTLELVDYGTTSYAGGVAERSHNIELAASRLDGYLVPPGATFSFNQALGPTTIDTGYRIAWGIMAGNEQDAPPRTVPSVGGGICQVATTLFHAVFWAGYPVEERNWHLYWIPKYGVFPKGMQGLDATVDDPYGVDFKWTNPTDKAVLIQARTDGGRISFALYGQPPEWDVSVKGPLIDGRVPANKTEIVRQNEPSMPAGRTLQVEEARDGFRATIVRTVTQPGKDPRTTRFVSEYQPSRNVVLVGTGGRR